MKHWQVWFLTAFVLLSFNNYGFAVIAAVVGALILAWDMRIRKGGPAPLPLNVNPPPSGPRPAPPPAPPKASK